MIFDNLFHKYSDLMSQTTEANGDTQRDSASQSMVKLKMWGSCSMAIGTIIQIANMSWAKSQTWISKQAVSRPAYIM